VCRQTQRRAGGEPTLLRLFASETLATPRVRAASLCCHIRLLALRRAFFLPVFLPAFFVARFFLAIADLL
jgi:hypothetical protein